MCFVFNMFLEVCEMSRVKLSSVVTPSMARDRFSGVMFKAILRFWIIRPRSPLLKTDKSFGSAATVCRGHELTGKNVTGDIGWL
jgi:hypothetical protein